MSDMPIGALARRAGLAPSAIRYYESQGLLPHPVRRGGQRRYALQDLGRLRIIQLALSAGFTVAETRTFLTGFSAAVVPAARWRALAERKVAELNAQMERCSRMKVRTANTMKRRLCGSKTTATGLLESLTDVDFAPARST